MNTQHKKMPLVTEEDGFFNKLYDDYYTKLVEYADSYLSDNVVSKDLVQELFITIYNKKIKFLSELSLKNFLFKSIHNSCLNYIKHREVENHNIEKYKEEQYLVWESQLNEKVFNMVYKEIDKLPSRCREIFLLHLDNLSNEEIAVKLSLSIETVKTQKKKAKRILREHFAKSDINLFYILLIISSI